MLILSKYTIGAIASKKDKELSPVYLIISLANSLEVNGPVATKI